PTEHARDLVAPRVDAAAGTADARDAGERGGLPRVFEPQGEGGRSALEADDVALVLEDLGEVGLEPAGRDVDGLVARADGVAQAREHVAHRVVHGGAATARGLLGCGRLARALRARAI